MKIFSYIFLVIGFIFKRLNEFVLNINQLQFIYVLLFGVLFYLKSSVFPIDDYNNACNSISQSDVWYCGVFNSVTSYLFFPEAIVYGLMIVNLVALYKGSKISNKPVKETVFLYILIPYILLRFLSIKPTESEFLMFFHNYYYLVGEYGFYIVVLLMLIGLSIINGGISFTLPKMRIPKVSNKDESPKKIFTTGKFNLSLLRDGIKMGDLDKSKVNKNGSKIKELLSQFKIDVDITGYKVGPTVIQYRLKPKEGMKVQKIENLKKDIALTLHAKSVRIQAPIPGLGVVGIEVPNPKRETVYIKDVISSREFNKSTGIPFALGKDVNGDVVIGDLTKMPHLLVAGQTGSGKSVGMNGFIISMLYKFSPSELKMIMVDPKRVELSVYNGIPHLLTPVITNPDKALNSLKWLVAEMLRRYDLATKVSARNLQEYNEKVDKKDKLPYIVMIIDELADLMMSGNKKEVESSIARIAQMARAVGIHLIIATQRPSVDVITGLIKANIPSRIAFTVASQIDSRTIIDKGGAEDLLGRGDMLYFPSGNMEAERIQGLLVETSEVEAVVNELKLNNNESFTYSSGIVDGGNIDEEIKNDIQNNKEDSSIIKELEEKIKNDEILMDLNSTNYLIIKILINNNGYNSRKSLTDKLNPYGITHNMVVTFVRLVKELEIVSYDTEKKTNFLKKDLTINEIQELYEKMDKEM